jgi:hypothetical protein
MATKEINLEDSLILNNAKFDEAEEQKLTESMRSKKNQEHFSSNKSI